MRRWALVALAMMIAGESQAQTSLLANAGFWSAYGGRTNDGDPTCAVGTSFRTGGRNLVIQWVAPNINVHFRVVRETWSIPNGTRISVRLRIDGFPAWEARATGSGREVRWSVGGDALSVFAREFRAGMVMRIEFTDGNEPPWDISLSGTNAVTEAFVSCLRAMNAGRQSSQPTQPFTPRPAQPTQPFQQPVARGEERRT